MRRLRLGLICLVLLGLLLGVDQAHGAITFKSEAQVAGDYITLSNLAEMPSELAQKCSAAPVWSTLSPREVYTLTQELLKHRLDELGIMDYLEGAALPAAIQVWQIGVPLKGNDVAGLLPTLHPGSQSLSSQKPKHRSFPLKGSGYASGRAGNPVALASPQ